MTKNFFEPTAGNFRTLFSNILISSSGSSSLGVVRKKSWAMSSGRGISPNKSSRAKLTITSSLKLTLTIFSWVRLPATENGHLSLWHMYSKAGSFSSGIEKTYLSCDSLHHSSIGDIVISVE